MSNNSLIPIGQSTINGEVKQTVDARRLHGFLEAKTESKNWIVRRINDFGFEEEKDFRSFLTESTGGRPTKEYAITLDMSKELSMVERNAKGKQARQYFIECENKVSV
ncbi:MAG: antA/AntB antirepressor family protein [Nitrospirae bacterium]|nr:antA/AntB antirepressor family protein [Nitrospirota bacterium]